MKSDRDFSNLVLFVHSNIYRIDYIKLVHSLTYISKFHNIDRTFLHFNDFIPYIDIIGKRRFYVFFARHIPKTTFVFINSLINAHTSKVLYDDACKRFRHPRVERSLLLPFKITHQHGDLND